MTRKVVVAVDGDTPQAVALLEWVAKNLTLRGLPRPAAKADACDAVVAEETGSTSGTSAPPPDDVGVTILHAMLPSQVPDWGFFPLYQADKLWAAVLAEDQRRAAAAATALRDHATRLHLPAKVVTLAGDPRSVVAEFVDAAKADLLVVGSRGLSGIRKLLLGSVSSYLVSHVECSVVVYRPAKEEDNA
ncbi:hypothetical protein MMPV_002118 [Pyropia vietnamensis]